jgi:CBS domain-containing protein
MATEIVAVGEEADVGLIAQKMLDHHVHRVLVIKDEQLVGLISTTDLLGLLARWGYPAKLDPSVAREDADAAGLPS